MCMVWMLKRWVSEFGQRMWAKGHCRRKQVHGLALGRGRPGRRGLEAAPALGEPSARDGRRELSGHLHSELLFGGWGGKLGKGATMARRIGGSGARPGLGKAERSRAAGSMCIVWSMRKGKNWWDMLWVVE